MLKQYMIRCWSLSAAALAVLAAAPTHAAPLNLSQIPLYIAPTATPLNMLVVGRDHKLYYEAYNDASDLNGDGKIDVGYKGYLPNDAGGIDYYGYFDSYKCYTYANDLFSPVRFTTDKQCGEAGEWSGDYLNYLTMSRIDALRKVLYGGKRAVDTDSSTVLVRSHIPMDAHSWGKEYSWDAPAAFDIRKFTPFERPTQGKRHLFANTTPNVNASVWTDDNGQPRLRVLTNQTYRIWEWVSKESPVAGTRIAPAGSGDVTVDPTDYQVRIEVCKSEALIDSARNTENCRRYPDGNYKPTGLLHEFGENDSMMFGLLSGSYTANKSGGVLRKNVSSFRDEINEDDGTWNTNVQGIVHTLDSLRSAAYTRYTSNGGTSYDCGLPAMARGAPADGTCRMWGNPVAEMMYETLKYFNGMSPTSQFTAIQGSSNTNIESVLGLPRPAWRDPYSDAKYPTCSKPFQTVMADINNSYDSDQLPGSRFANAVSPSGPLPGLDVGDLADKITSVEGDIAGREFFIGEANGEYDGTPTPKTVTSLATARGLAPEEPTKEGGYYAASVAYHGRTNRANSLTEQRVQTFAVALASPLPQIKIPMGDDRFITLVPFAKSVAYGSDIKRDRGQFQPTNQIVDFYVEDIAEDQRSGTFQVNFEDVEAGNDHDMDAIVRYSYRVTGANTVQVDVTSDYQAGGIVHHIGYVISGTDGTDGVYLVVQDCNKQTDGTYICNGSDPDYFLDTPPGELPGGKWNDGEPLPATSSRTFTASSGSGASLLKDPLWYAAKWGGFEDVDGGQPNVPDDPREWDANGDGIPDNYFLVTNALTLSQQLRETFSAIINRSSSVTAVAVNGGAISTDTRIYQARFDTADWSGELRSYALENREVVTPARWEASARMRNTSWTARNIITVNNDGSAVPFTWDNGIDDDRKLQLHSNANIAKTYLEYLRGDPRNEVRNGGTLRNRATASGQQKLLGDIISSAPLYVGSPRGRYSDRLEKNKYSEFFDKQRKRDGVVYVGANDGMLHAFRADQYYETRDPETNRLTQTGRKDRDGEELLAFIPKTVFGNLEKLTRPSYSHQYFVDGSPNSNDVYFDDEWHTVLVGGLNNGGQGIYALDVTDPEKLGKNSFLWEINDRTPGFEDLGYTYSQPAIVRLGDKEDPETRQIPPGVWVAAFGNGYNNTEVDQATSATGNAVLYIVDIETGKLLKAFDTGVGSADDPTGQNRPNGLATPTMVDTDGDRIVDFAYVGDLFGNVWKINVSGSDPNDWDFAFKTAGGKPAPFFVAKDDDGNRQPITSRMEAAPGPYGVGVQLLFGTGKYLEGMDKIITPTRVQTFYGLYDANGNVIDPEADPMPAQIDGRDRLVKQTIDREFRLADGTYGRTTSQNKLGSRMGWYMDLVSPGNLYQGERVIANPFIRDDRIVFSTLIPNNDACGAGARTWTMILDVLTGKMLPGQVDTNGDGSIDPPPGGSSGGIGNPDDPEDPDGPGTPGGDDEEYDEDLGGFGGQEGGEGGGGHLTCATKGCAYDYILSIDKDGNIDARAMRSFLGTRGRQSWRQIR
ncbi:pilus assembly protein [Steroidobacter sp.]|uniref:pilus assembly protein n=1 Tax=Steroidobacter sp. TaxID=1978227 RepID=UPI002ED8DD6D